ncbi:hypothetical protein F2Q70_00040416 [Brassica cretica]|uniref:Uncharacterized protein n=1 Tax=Brassica cretica TaxID=69181 RepID=A0A8S9KA35_BRACR|nr:hypothetical protein F2Q70_00040416 [Brassica cretica]
MDNFAAPLDLTESERESLFGLSTPVNFMNEDPEEDEAAEEDETAESDESDGDDMLDPISVSALMGLGPRKDKAHSDHATSKEKIATNRRSRKRLRTPRGDARRGVALFSYTNFNSLHSRPLY